MREYSSISSLYEAETPERRLFAHVTMRVLVQSQRYVVFNIIDALVARHRQGAHTSPCTSVHLHSSFDAALKSMNEEFLAGYVALAEGEKDPRNLLLAFAIARVLLIEFDITHHTEVSGSLS